MMKDAAAKTGSTRAAAVKTAKVKTASGSVYLRIAMAMIALVLPTLSLAVLGTIWLWQNNLLLIWSVCASVAAILIFAIERWIVHRNEPTIETRAAGDTGAAALDNADAERSKSTYGHTEQERRAAEAVEAFARSVDAAQLGSREGLQDLAVASVETVARAMHPDEKNAIWKFTVPEALVLTERVSARMNRFVAENVPLGDRLTVGQLLQIYKWRSAIGVAEKAYGLWRILRFANPASAISGEVRERLSGQLVAGLRTELMRTLAQTYVREIGYAAIDLYSGRLRPGLAAFGDDRALQRAIARRPLRYVLIGRTGAGKSSLINAIKGSVVARVDALPGDSAAVVHTHALAGERDIELLETPGLARVESGQDEVLDQAAGADALVMVISAVRPDRSLEADALRGLREMLAADDARRFPPLVIAMTHIDQLRPANEWEPPYDIAEPHTNKARAIRDALESIAEDLGVARGDVVPVAAERHDAAYNIDALEARLVEVETDAAKTQLSRLAAAAAGAGVKWGKIWSQARNAGRVVGSTIWGSRRSRPDEKL